MVRFRFVFARPCTVNLKFQGKTAVGSSFLPASVCETLYRESGKFGGRQLLVAAFFLSFILLCYSMGFYFKGYYSNINLL